MEKFLLRGEMEWKCNRDEAQIVIIDVGSAPVGTVQQTVHAFIDDHYGRKIPAELSGQNVTFAAIVSRFYRYSFRQKDTNRKKVSFSRENGTGTGIMEMKMEKFLLLGEME